MADFWNRGLLDLAVAASTDRHALLRHRGGLGRRWLQVELEGAAGELAEGTNRDAVGARVEVEAGGMRQLREVVLGDGYGSQSPLRLHFGLGEAATVDALTVRWPRSGQVERFEQVAADRLLRLREGTGELVEPGYGERIPDAESDPDGAGGD